MESRARTVERQPADGLSAHYVYLPQTRKINTLYLDIQPDLPLNGLTQIDFAPHISAHSSEKMKRFVFRNDSFLCDNHDLIYQAVVKQSEGKEEAASMIFNSKTRQFLGYLLTVYHRSPKANRGAFIVDLNDMQRELGFTSRQLTARYYREQMDILSRFTFTYTEEIRTRNHGQLKVEWPSGIVDAGEIVTGKHKDLRIARFSQDFLREYQRSDAMAVPDCIFSHNLKTNSSTGEICHALSLQRYIGRGTNDRISVQTLLKKAKSIPSIEKVALTNRSYKSRIQDKMIRDMMEPNFMAAIKWQLIDPEGNTHTPQEACKLPFKTFLGSQIQFEFIDYPAPTVEA